MRADNDHDNDYDLRKAMQGNYSVKDNAAPKRVVAEAKGGKWASLSVIPAMGTIRKRANT